LVSTSSAQVKLGTHAPPFSLPDAKDRMVSLEDLEGANGLVVVSWCNHCPYVRHIKAAFTAFAREYKAKGLAIVAINANDIETYPLYGPDRMLEDIAEFGCTFDYLLDESQDIARAYDPACTPDFFLFDADMRLAYRGQFDASRPSNDVPVDGRGLRAAADAVLADRQPPADQVPSIGCNIKWRH